VAHAKPRVTLSGTTVAHAPPYVILTQPGGILTQLGILLTRLGVMLTQPGVILSGAKNLSVTVLAIPKTTERFFASLRMTASRWRPQQSLWPAGNLVGLRIPHWQAGQVLK
jgi:hypothetical protein